MPEYALFVMDIANIQLFYIAGGQRNYGLAIEKLKPAKAAGFPAAE